MTEREVTINTEDMEEAIDDAYKAGQGVMFKKIHSYMRHKFDKDELKTEKDVASLLLELIELHKK